LIREKRKNTKKGLIISLPLTTMKIDKEIFRCTPINTRDGKMKKLLSIFLILLISLNYQCLFCSNGEIDENDIFTIIDRQYHGIADFKTIINETLLENDDQNIIEWSVTIFKKHQNSDLSRIANMFIMEVNNYAKITVDLSKEKKRLFDLGFNKSKQEENYQRDKLKVYEKCIEMSKKDLWPEIEKKFIEQYFEKELKSNFFNYYNYSRLHNLILQKKISIEKIKLLLFILNESQN
jgi:hypothetical protein